MKILICIASLSGGGAERQVVYLANGLADIGYDVNILLLEGGINKSKLSELINVDILSIKPRSLKLVFLTTKLIYKIKPDIIYLWQHPFDIVGGILGLILGLPVIHAERTNPEKIHHGIKFLLRNLVVSKSSGVITNSIQGLVYWNKRLKDSRVLRVKNIIPLDDIAGVAPSLETRGKLVTVSRLDSNKNIKSLIKAIHSLSLKGVSVHLAIIGDGLEANNLKNLVKCLSLEDSVTFLGYRNDAWSLLKGSSGFISLSLFEGQPNSVLEAASLGCPMILSNIPPHLELNGFASVVFVDPTSIDEISIAIETLLSNPNRGKINENNLIDKFLENSIKSIVDSHIDFFKLMTTQ